MTDAPSTFAAEFDENGALLNAAECIGEIVNPDDALMFEGYYNNPEASAQRLQGSAYHSGDLGYRDRGRVLRLRRPQR